MRYLCTEASRAWSDSKRFYGSSGRALFLLLAPFVVGVVLRIEYDTTDVTPFVKSGLFGVAATIVVFVTVLAWNFLLAPSRIDAELRVRIANLERQTETQEQKAATTQLLKERHEAGVAIRDSTNQLFSRLDALKVRKWHSENLRLLEGAIAPDEFYLYRTIVPDDPPLKGARVRFGLNSPQSDLERFAARLDKLRLMVARHMKEVGHNG